MPSWQVLVEELQAQQGELAAACLTRIRREIPGYASQSIGALQPSAERHVDFLLSGMLDAPAPPPDEEFSTSADLGSLRAKQGVAVDDMLLGFRCAIDEIRKQAFALAEAKGVAPVDLLEFTDRLLAWGDAMVLAGAVGHRETELELRRREQHYRGNLLRGILFEAVPASELIVQATTYGLDVAQPYYAIRARPPADLSTLELERRLGVVTSVRRQHGLAALVDGDLVGFVDSLPAADRDLGTPVGVGPAAPLQRLRSSFELATRALEIGIATDETSACVYEDLGLRPAVLVERDIGERLVERYLGALVRSGGSTEAFIETVERYLGNGRRLGRTAAELNLHPNSVRYRLRRFEELTGADLNRVEDVVELWWALERRRLTSRS